MWERRIFYGISLLGCGVFYLVYQQWFSFLLLLTVAVLPWLSLALSYPAMRSVTVTVRCPSVTRMGVPARTSMQVKCRYPIPPLSCRIRLVNSLTGECYVGNPGELIPTDHCGKITVSASKACAYDYLGLFRKKLPQCSCACYVLPKPVPSDLPATGSDRDNVLRAKVGGGMSEFHELRLYRPGDNLRNIHWKASAKTGKLIYREAMEQAKRGYVLTFALCGTADQLDKKLGQLLWSSRALLNQKRPHRIHCLTGKGMVALVVKNVNSLEEGLRRLVAMPCAEADTLLTEDVLWQQSPGGDIYDA